MSSFRYFLVLQTNGSCYPAAFIQLFYIAWCQYLFQKENVGGDPEVGYFCCGKSQYNTEIFSIVFNSWIGFLIAKWLSLSSYPLITINFRKVVLY